MNDCQASLGVEPPQRVGKSRHQPPPPVDAPVDPPKGRTYEEKSMGSVEERRGERVLAACEQPHVT